MLFRCHIEFKEIAILLSLNFGGRNNFLGFFHSSYWFRSSVTIIGYLRFLLNLLLLLLWLSLEPIKLQRGWIWLVLRITLLNRTHMWRLIGVEVKGILLGLWCLLLLTLILVVGISVGSFMGCVWRIFIFSEDFVSGCGYIIPAIGHLSPCLGLTFGACRLSIWFCTTSWHRLDASTSLIGRWYMRLWLGSTICARSTKVKLFRLLSLRCIPSILLCRTACPITTIFIGKLILCLGLSMNMRKAYIIDAQFKMLSMLHYGHLVIHNTEGIWESSLE